MKELNKINTEEEKEHFILKLLNYREQINLPLLEEFPRIKNVNSNSEINKNISTKNDERIFYVRYKPLIPYLDYIKWRDASFDGILFRNICVWYTTNYTDLINKCFNWYYENSLDESRFDLKVQLAEYKSMLYRNSSSCPVLKLINPDFFDINYLKKVKDIMNFAKKNNINHYNQLIISPINDPTLKEIHELRRLLQNSINCIVYMDFKFFLEEQYKLYKSQQKEEIYYKQSNIQGKEPQKSGDKEDTEIIIRKPNFTKEAAEIIYDIIKIFFHKNQQNELKRILETGDNAKTRLIFLDNGNRLTDTFRKLIEYDFITGYNKKELIDWIVSNFMFTHQKKHKPYKSETVEKTMCRNDFPCKNPIIKIENGQILKVNQPKTKKYK